MYKAVNSMYRNMVYSCLHDRMKESFFTQASTATVTEIGYFVDLLTYNEDAQDHWQPVNKKNPITRQGLKLYKTSIILCWDFHCIANCLFSIVIMRSSYT